MPQDAHHVPVLPDAVIAGFAESEPAILVDCTLGLGGHTARLLEHFPSLRVIGLDLDETNLAIAAERLTAFGDRFQPQQGSFSAIDELLASLRVDRVDGLLADLGISSNQLDDPDRGLSFDADGPLDMRLDRNQRVTAADLVNSLPEGELSDLLYFQSQERHSRRIARRICQVRRQGRINSTVMLARLVASAVGENPDSHRGRIHPATRTFMALRMSVNREIESLQRLLALAPDLLSPRGRIAVISFHSVEDRAVKHDFRERAKTGQYAVVTRKPLIATESERRSNPRSRSAKLRIAERLPGS